MNVKMCITHVQSGCEWSGAAVELTENELAEMKEVMASRIANMNYVELDGVILPGDFVRNHCVFTFLTV